MKLSPCHPARLDKQQGKQEGRQTVAQLCDAGGLLSGANHLEN